MSRTWFSGVPLAAQRLVLRFYVPTIFAICGLAILVSLICLLIAQQADTNLLRLSLIHHNQDVLSDVRRLDVLIRDAERGQRGYLVTGSREYLEPYEAARNLLQPLSEHLRQLLANNPVQQERLISLRSAMRQKLAELQETIQLRTSFDEDAARRVVMDDRGRLLMGQITTLLDAIIADENQVLPKGNAAIELTWRRLRELAWGGLAAAILFMALAAQMLRQGAVLRRKMTLDKEQQRQELARSNADLEEFAYAASHDLKAPLRAIANLVRWINEDIAATASPETLENLNLLDGRATRLQMLLDGLLAYSRIGRTHPSVEDVDIAKMVRDVAEMLAPPPGFVIACEATMATIYTHLVSIQVVLQNLICNALKHHDHSEGRIIVSVRQIDGMAEFRVTDDGPGIEPRYQERIFAIFQTLASRDEAVSSGIGLAIVKKKVLAHGGRVWIESAPPVRGSTFAFTWKEATR